jgi:6-pyruvoyltetrahydropterin/6-carboxytetrahydropterin synthase
MMILFKQFTFDSAHFLPLVPDGHKCKNIHGHTYHLTVYLDGEPDPEAGWLIDFSDVKNVIAPVIASIDHTLLNDIVGLENPTAENLAIWLWRKIKPELPSLSKIEIKETPTSGVIYEGK